MGMTIANDRNIGRAIEGRQVINLLNSVLWDWSISNSNKPGYITQLLKVQSPTAVKYGR